MHKIFNRCKSLLSLPDISQWDTSKVRNMSMMFFRCESISSFPDLSKWKTPQVINISHMFSECRSLFSMPDITKCNILNVKVSAGDSVNKGDVLVVLEAMKMENDIVAPQNGTVASINVSKGDTVEAGQTLITMN